jgi:transposase
MGYFAGLDIGLERTAVCVIDAAGRRIAETQLPTEPELLVAWLRRQADAYERLGLEACPLSDWLHDELAAAGLPVVCLETHQLRATLAAMTHKTDRNDARGIAQVLRTGWFKAVHAKSRESRRWRSLVVSRRLLVRQALKLENSLRGTLKAFGHKPATSCRAARGGASRRRCSSGSTATQRCWRWRDRCSRRGGRCWPASRLCTGSCSPPFARTRPAGG